MSIRTFSLAALLAGVLVSTSLLAIDPRAVEDAATSKADSKPATKTEGTPEAKPAEEPAKTGDSKPAETPPAESKPAGAPEQTPAPAESKPADTPAGGTTSPEQAPAAKPSGSATPAAGEAKDDQPAKEDTEAEAKAPKRFIPTTKGSADKNATFPVDI